MRSVRYLPRQIIHKESARGQFWTQSCTAALIKTDIEPRSLGALVSWLSCWEEEITSASSNTLVVEQFAHPPNAAPQLLLKLRIAPPASYVFGDRCADHIRYRALFDSSYSL